MLVSGKGPGGGVRPRHGRPRAGKPGPDGRDEDVHEMRPVVTALAAEAARFVRSPDPEPSPALVYAAMTCIPSVRLTGAARRAARFPCHPKTAVLSRRF